MQNAWEQNRSFPARGASVRRGAVRVSPGSVTSSLFLHVVEKRKGEQLSRNQNEVV